MAQPKRMAAPLAGTAVLEQVQDPFNAQLIPLEAPEADGEKAGVELREAKRKVEALFPRKNHGNGQLYKTTAADQPVVTKSFIADSLPGIPPDNYLAVSKAAMAVSVVNSNIAVLNAVTGQMTQRKSLISFTQSVGLNNSPGNSNNYRYDPKVIYDPEADRYIMVVLNGVNQYNWIIFGFSQTNNPAGTWNFYKLYGDYAADSLWFDYPTIALTKDEFFLTGNKLCYNCGFKEGWRKSVIYQVRKADGYNGATSLNYQLWDSVQYQGQFIRNLFPVKGGLALSGPDQYFVSNRNMDLQNDSVFLVRLPDTIGGATNLTVTALKSNLSYGIPPDGRQRSTYYKLATNDGRILGAYRQGNEIQFVSATNSPGGSSAIYHGRIANFNSTPTLSGSQIAIDTLDFGYPNISCAGNGSNSNPSIISFNYTGPGLFPGFAAVYWDGSQHSPLTIVKTGDSVIRRIPADTVQRWGDYTGSQIDWNVPGAVWAVGIFGRKDRNYGNFAVRLRNPSLTDVAFTNSQKTAAVLFPNPVFQYLRVQFEADRRQEVQFTITDLQGRTVASVLRAYCEAGTNEFQFNTASLPSGQYLLLGTGAQGQALLREPFVRE
jgi:hypothetical protein